MPVKLAAAHILVNSAGMTLYLLTNDSKGKSACYKGCATAWPPLGGHGEHVAASVRGIVGTLGVISRTDGTRQVTFDGAPSIPSVATRSRVT